MLSEGQVGIQLLNDGANQTIRLTKLAAQVVQELHGRFYEQTYRGNMFSIGTSNAALTTTSAIATGLTASAAPIVALWNPLTSAVNLVILQATIVTTTIANSAVAPSGFMWVGSAGNASITAAATVPWNAKSLTQSGSYAKAFTLTALTGLTTNLTVIRATAIAPLNASGAATAASIIQGQSVENVDGSIIVPPGGVVGIMNQVSTTTVNVSAGLLWEEVPI